jgi:F-type H+-transporting ATPase subunit gamma
MAERLEELERRIEAIGELHEIVGAMRALAAMRLEQATTALAGARAYADAISEALGMALIAGGGPVDTGPPKGARGLVLFTPEHGFAGLLARHLVEMAAAEAEHHCRIFLVGGRGIAIASEHRLRTAWQAPMATQLGAAAATARRISTELHRQFAAGDLISVEILFASYQGGGRSDALRHRLLPIDPVAHRTGRLHQPPLTNMTLPSLLPRLVEEYFFAELAHIVVETLAAENGARLAAMQSVRRNIEEKLEELRRSERRERQSAITAEIAEISAGVAAFNADWSLASHDDPCPQM